MDIDEKFKPGTRVTKTADTGEPRAVFTVKKFKQHVDENNEKINSVILSDGTEMSVTDLEPL